MRAGIFLYLYAVKRLSAIITLLLSLVSFSISESPFACYAQQAASDWQQYYEMLANEEDYSDEDGNEQLELIYDALSEVASSPINLNAITRDDLENLILFSEQQIDAILEFVGRYAPMRTMAEVHMIPFLDTARRGLLTTLTYLGECPPKQRDAIDSLKYEKAVNTYRQYYQQESKGEIVAFTRVPFYTRKGDGDAYQGGKLKDWFRMNYTINRHIKIGAVAAQDAGEPFFKGCNKYGFDFYSGYVQLQRFGALKKMVIGRYRIKTGLGLILNNNFTFGKLFSLGSIQSSNVSLRPHSSRSESNYLQGAAATFALTKQLETTIFGSYRKIDATLTDDSLGIATILRTGYHRTESEIRRKHNASQSSAGLNIRWTNKNFHLGATALINHYDKPLMPYEEGSSLTYLYKRFYASGKDFWNVSIDYGYKLGKLLRVEGETATGDSRKIATINTISWLVTKKLNLMAIQRYYPYEFYATMGRSFSEGGSNQDESGVYIGASWNPNTRLSFTAYTDIAYFAWPKYQALGSSHSFDNLVQLTFRTSKHSSLTARYRIRMREKNSDNEGELIYKDEQRLRVAYNMQSGKLTWKSQVDFAFCKYKQTNWGGMLSTNATYSLKKLKVGIGTGYFNTGDYENGAYNARVYAYELSTPYNLSFPSFYGEGIRAYTLAQADIMKKLSVIAKCGMTHYFDRKEIGSSYQKINSSTQTDLDIMLRYRF